MASLQSAVDTGLDDECLFTPSSSEGEEHEMEVRWLMSGELAGVVSIGPNTSLVDLQAQLLNLTGVPACDQRLYADGEALRCTELPPDVVRSSLSVLRVTTDPRKTNLGHFHVPLSFDALAEGTFTTVRTLANGLNGDIVACKWLTNESEEMVAVKKVSMTSLDISQSSTEFCERDIHLGCEGKAPDPEDALAEIGVLMYLAQQEDLPIYLLKAQAVFAASSCMWLVSEFADGGELFDVAASPRPLAEAELKRYLWQLLQATDYLHRHRIAHRDISLENVLLKDGSVRLMDFGMAVQSHSSSGACLRYFRGLGKDFYRPPECYVPAAATAKVTPRAGDCAGDVCMLRCGDCLCEVRLPPDATPHKPCTAEVWGYAACPADIFSVGICMFILAFQNPAWNQAVLADPNFSCFFRLGDGGVQGFVQMWQKRALSPAGTSLLNSMMQVGPARRPTAAQCLSSPWFAEYRDCAVATHSKQVRSPSSTCGVKRRRTSEAWVETANGSAQ